MTYCIASMKLSREKTFANFAVCGYSQKFSPRNSRAWCPFVRQKRAIRESFLRENRIFHQFLKVFSLESFPLYGNCLSYMLGSDTKSLMSMFFVCIHPLFVCIHPLFVCIHPLYE